MPCWAAIGAEALRQREVGQMYEAAPRNLALLRGLFAALPDQQRVPGATRRASRRTTTRSPTTAPATRSTPKVEK